MSEVAPTSQILACFGLSSSPSAVQLITPISHWREANTVGQHEVQDRPSLGNVPAQESWPVVQEATKLRA